MIPNQIILKDCKAGLKQLPAESVDCCVTSPPYFGLRNYGNDSQIGLEETPEAFVSELVEIFSEVRRVLKPEGTLWLNLGDSYSGSGKGIGDTTGNKWKQGTNKVSRNGKLVKVKTGLKNKDLIGIPWMVAFALRSSGWYLRQDIIWNKPNPMPESVTDRCTKSHEYIFLLSKNAKYYYDHEAIKTPLAEGSISRVSQDIENQKGSNRVPGKSNGNMKAAITETANKKSVWTVTTKPFKEAHFATYPQELIYDCIKAGCPENGIVLDPFMGAGTTAVVAKKLNRNYIGFELNPEYKAIAEKRLFNEIGMFL